MRQSFVANPQTTERVIQPGKGSLNHPALGHRGAANQVRSAAFTTSASPSTLGDVESNLSFLEDGPELPAVIPFVCNETPRPTASPNMQTIQSGNSPDQVVMGGRHDGQRQGNSLGIDNQRAFRSVDTDFAGRANFRAPFLAGTVDASNIVCSSRSLSWRLSRINKVCQRFSQVPLVIHWLNRRWQVAGEPYFSGRSDQRQPVRST